MDMKPVRIVVQLNGKIIESFWITNEVPIESVQQIAMNIPTVKKALKEKNIIKIIAVPKRLVNIITK